MANYPSVGDKAPAFSMNLHDGSKVSDLSMMGKTYVMYFYPKDDTSGCTLEAQGFTQVIKDFEAKGCSVIGVSKDDTKSHCKFIEKYNLGVKLATDDTNVCEAFGVWQEKSMYGKKYMGIARTTFLIDATGHIAKVWVNVKPDGHHLEVLQSL